jgi:hypothetical protein
MSFHLVVFALGLLSYAAAAFGVVVLLRPRRDGRRYAAAWAWGLAGASAWLVVVFVRWDGCQGLRRLANALAEPDDGWGLLTFLVIEWFRSFAPLPLAMAALCARPKDAWWKRTVVRSAFGVEAVVLSLLHIGYHGTCVLTVIDQHGWPVANAEIETVPFGEVRLGAVGLLGRLSDGRATEALATMLTDESATVRRAAVARLAVRQDGGPALRSALRSADPELRRIAAEALVGRETGSRKDPGIP